MSMLLSKLWGVAVGVATASIKYLQVSKSVQVTVVCCWKVFRCLRNFVNVQECYCCFKSV